MRDFASFLDAFMASKGVKNDAALAKLLEISRTSVSRIRHSGGASDELCLQIAEAIGEEPGIVLASRNAVRETGAVGDAWKRLLGQFAGIAILIGGALIALQLDAGEAPLFASKSLILLVKITGIIASAFAFKQLALNIGTRIQ